jgi:hypothetical protein
MPAQGIALGKDMEHFRTLKGRLNFFGCDGRDGIAAVNWPAPSGLMIFLPG